MEEHIAPHHRLETIFFSKLYNSANMTSKKLISILKAELTQIIPTECGCQRQIGLFQEIGSWEEADDYLPLPGDIIYYSRNNQDPFKDCIGWADHVGIVVGTSGNRIKVIEGNYGDKVDYRYLKVDATIIRGFGIPDYRSLAE